MNRIYPDKSRQNRNLMKHLGLCLFFQGNIQESYKFLKIYLAFKKDTENSTPKHKISLGSVYYYIGIYYYFNSQIEEAYINFQECENFEEKVTPLCLMRYIVP